MSVKRWAAIALGFATGLLNGLFGAGGGMAAVPMLEMAGLPPKSAHATAIAITMPLSVLSGVLYLGSGEFAIGDALHFIPAGIVGAVVGAFLLGRVANVWLRRIFGALILVAAVRLLVR